jgi:hypothetical protein
VSTLASVLLSIVIVAIHRQPPTPAMTIRPTPSARDEHATGQSADRRVTLGVLLAALCWTWSAGAQGAADLKPPMPIEAIGGILNAFRTHDVIGLCAGADHGDARGPAFIVSLIRDPGFAPGRSV